MDNSHTNKKKQRYMVPITITGYVNVYVYAESEEEAEAIVADNPDYNLEDLNVTDVFVGDADLWESYTNTTT